jgi:hypothetical protein
MVIRMNPPSKVDIYTDVVKMAGLYFRARSGWTHKYQKAGVITFLLPSHLFIKINRFRFKYFFTRKHGGN